MNKQLKERIYGAAEGVEGEHVGIAFSGGLDSSLLAKVCKDIGKNVTLLTLGFSSRRDIQISKDVSKSLELPLLHRTIPSDELEHGLREVLSIIEYDRIARLENCVCFYYVFRMSSGYEIYNVLSANGADELFCGYHIYTREYKADRNFMTDLMSKLVGTAMKDKEQIDRISGLFDIRYDCPFLSEDFIQFAMKIPINLKIKGKKDKVRKHVLRKVALEIGVPRSATFRQKKAFQYSSGLHKAIQRLAKKRGFTKRKARQAGYRSAMEAYIKSLKDPQVHKLNFHKDHVQS